MSEQLAEMLRAKIRDSGLTLTRIGELTGIPQPRLTVFMQGGDIRLSTAEKLAAHFRLTLRKGR